MENNHRTERILKSLDGLHKAAAPDFFYTRLMGRMQREEQPGGRPFGRLRPLLVVASLAIVFLINIFSLTALNRQPKPTGKPATIESFAAAYNMNTPSVYE